MSLFRARTDLFPAASSFFRRTSAPQIGSTSNLLFHTHRNLNLPFTGRTLPGKSHHPVAPHLRLELRAIHAWHTRFGHVASGMHHHTWHVHGQISLHCPDICGLAARI